MSDIEKEAEYKLEVSLERVWRVFENDIPIFEDNEGGFTKVARALMNRARLAERKELLNFLMQDDYIMTEVDQRGIETQTVVIDIEELKAKLEAK